MTNDRETGISRIDATCAAINRGELDPFDGARAMWSAAMSSMTESGDPSLHGHWLLWGTMTDNPTQPPADVDRIRRAASEWARIAENDHQRHEVDEFLARWLYGELGLPRP